MSTLGHPATLIGAVVHSPRRHVLVDASVGVGIAVLAAIVRLALGPLLGPDLPYVTFLPAVAIAAWARGAASGAAATGIGTLASILFILPRDGWSQPAQVVGLLLFVAMGGLITGLGWQLEGARRIEAEGRARAAFLSEASAVLGTRLGRLSTIDALTRVAVPAFADWCAIDLFDEDGRFVDARIAAPDPEKVGLAQELRRRYPYTPDAAMGVAAVFRTGEPEFVLDVPPDFFAVIPDPALRALVEGLQFRSFISVPLVASDDRRLGVLSVVMSGSGRRFTRADVDTAADLARRAGTALEHAVLFEMVDARREELDAVLRAIDDPVLVAGPDGRVRSANPAAAVTLGDALGRPLEDVLAGLKPVPGKDDVRRVGGSRTFVVPLVFDVTAKGADARIAVLRDVSRVLESEAARDAFLGMLSHELRTPITTIFGMAQILHRPISEEARNDLLSDLAVETDRLYRLVEDLLVLSRFERGRLEISLEPVLVQRVVNATLARTAAQLPNLRVHVDAPLGLPPAQADPTYVEQVIRNLASNAVKYAGDTARIEVRIRATEDRVTIEFEDDGPGIPDAERERVFALYERLPDSAYKPGAGIGLFVCRRLVEGMGGSMSVREGSRGGALFQISLPTISEPVVG